MKKIGKQVVMILISVFLFSLLPIILYATTTGTINEKEVRLRATATSDGTVIELLNTNEEVEILEEKGQWYRVKYKEFKGYVLKKYVDIEEDTTNSIEQNTTNTLGDIEPEENTISNEVGTTNTVTTSTQPQLQEELKKGSKLTLTEAQDILARPLISSLTIGAIEPKEEILIIEIVNGWCYVSTKEAIGWIRLEKLVTNYEGQSTQQTVEDENPIQPQPEENKPEEPKKALNKTAYVITDGINFRDAPNTDSNILKVFIQNAKITLLEEEGEWYKAKSSDSIEGYILKTYVSDKKIETTSRSSSARKVTTTTGEVNYEANKQKLEETTLKEEKQTNESQEQAVIVETNKGEEIVAEAKKYLGKRYVYGGASPAGFDCSGFTMYIFKKFGVTLSHSATAQSKVGTTIPKNQLQPGDIVFFSDYKTYKGIGHCGIYIGEGKFIHASTESTGVITSSLNGGSYVKRYVTAKRMI